MKISDDEYKSKEGETIGNYFILEYIGRNNRNIPSYRVRCIKCDYETIMGWPAIKASIGHSAQCSHPNMWKSHGLFLCYTNMISRCCKEYNIRYEDYGAKGIDVDPTWIRSPWKFQEWALANGYQEGLTIDRIDSSRGYYPDNCRWITLSENSKWRSDSHYVMVNGKLNTCKGWGEELGMGQSTIGRYLRKHGYEKTAFHIVEIQNPGKIVPCVEVDQDMYYNKERERI